MGTPRHRRATFRTAMQDDLRPDHVEDMNAGDIDVAIYFLDDLDQADRDQESAERRLPNC